MDLDICNVIYLDRSAREERIWTRHSLPDEQPEVLGHRSTRSTSSRGAISPPDEVECNVRSLLAVFPNVSVFQSCAPCISAIEESCKASSRAESVMVLVSIPPGEETSSQARDEFSRTQIRSPSPRSRADPEQMATRPENPHGMDFLIYLAYRIRMQNLGSRIIPVVVRNSAQPSDTLPLFGSTLGKSLSVQGSESISLVPYFDAGAVDVLFSPITVDRANSLPSHVYRIHAERLRRQSSPSAGMSSKKTSWVGTKEGKPYTQIKEVMVCELMDHIVNPDRDELPIDPSVLQVDLSRHNLIANAIGTWHFSAHDFTDDELLHGALLMLQHTLKLPGLDQWRMSDDELVTFLLATRRVYNSSVLYHNFRHACDVLQATFYFLILIGAIPPYSEQEQLSTTNVSAGTHSLHGSIDPPPRQNIISASTLESLIDPFHALILLISAIGHDVGHPGVNNAFLVSVNAPLAQLYNDRSVLESFHCAAYSQILRRYWKSAFEDRQVRRLMITTILATDMGLHGDYMSQMASLQSRVPKDVEGFQALDESSKERERELLLCLLIKCADICNVARQYDTSAKWAKILIDEFFAQGQIEQDSNIPSALFGGPPDPENVLQKARSQIGFMSIFARPLFSGIATLLPALSIPVGEMDVNKAKWQAIVDDETAKEAAASAAAIETKTRFAHTYTGAEDNKTETDEPAGNNDSIFNTSIFKDSNSDSNSNSNSNRGRSKGPCVTQVGNVSEREWEHDEKTSIFERKASPRIKSIHFSSTNVATGRRASGGTATQVLSVTETGAGEREMRRSSLGPGVLPPEDYQSPLMTIKKKKKLSSIFRLSRS